MLSEKIAAMASQMEEHAHTGLVADAGNVALMASNLRDMAGDAEALERNTRPVAEMGGSAPLPIPEDGVVVRLVPVR